MASRLASWDEVAALVGVMGHIGIGIFEGADAGMSSPDPEARKRALDRMTALSARTGVPMTFGLVATRSAGYLIDFLDEAAAAGARMIAQTHCRGISVLLSLKTRLPFDLIPAWSDLRSQPLAEQLRILGRPAAPNVPFVEAAVHADYEGWTGVGAQARPPDFEGIRVYEHGLPPNPSVADVAAPARRPSGRGHDRPLRGIRRRPALHPAQPLPPRRRDPCCGHCGTRGRS